MMVKAIVRDNIIMADRIPTDTDLIALNCYYESFAFEIDSNMELEEKLEYAMNIIEPFTTHMKHDSIELIAV
jgi:hypothetical protein